MRRRKRLLGRLSPARRKHSVRDENIALSTLGDLAIAAGRLPDPVRHFETINRLFQLLAEDAPTNPDPQNDLSVSWIKIGDVRVAQGDLAGALDAYGASHAIADRFAAADPGNAEWQRDLIVSHVKLSEVAANEADERAHLLAALEIARGLEAAGRLAPVEAWMLADLQQRLATLDP